MQKQADTDSQPSRIIASDPLYFTVSYNGKLLDYSDAAALWMRKILDFPCDSSQSGSITPPRPDWHAGDLFKDPAQVSRAIKHVLECGQALENNLPIKLTSKTFCLATLFATTAHKQGEHDTDAVLFIVRPIAEIPEDPAGKAKFNERNAWLMESRRRQIWDIVWSQTLNTTRLRSPVNESLRLMGEYLNADRVYILNKKAEGAPLKIDFEWCDSRVPRLIDVDMPSPSDKKCPADFFHILEQKEPVHISSTSQLLYQAAEAFENRGVKSLLVTPYFQTGLSCLYVVAEFHDAMIQWCRDDHTFIHKLSMFLASVISYRRSETMKKGSEHALETLLSYLESSVFLLKKSSAEVIFANRVFMAFMGDDVVGKNCFDSNEQDLNAIFSELSRNEQQQHWTHGDGTLRFECFLPERYRWMLVECQIMSLHDDDDYLLCSALDITSRKEEEERLRRLSLTDPVSGAFYRQVGMRRLSEALEELADSQAPLSLVCISLDNYHLLHSDAGSERAEELLNFLVRTVQQEYGKNQVTRLSLNELMLHLPHTGIEECRRKFMYLPQRLVEKRDGRYSLYELSISIGFAESNELKRKNSATLVLEARQDLYRERNSYAPSLLPILL